MTQSDAHGALARAWPARDAVTVGSWTARIDGGVTRRANSVLPKGQGPPPTDARLGALIASAVGIYEARGLTPWIQVTDDAWPETLNDALDARGWTTGCDPTLILSGPVPPVTGTVEVRLSPTPHDAWLQSWLSMDSRVGETERACLMAILGRISEPRACARALVDGQSAGVAMGVLVDDVLVLECLATDPAARRLGVARSTLGALGQWAAGRGATRSLLAVQEANAPARGLYDALGLRRVGSYSYAHP